MGANSPVAGFTFFSGKGGGEIPRLPEEAILYAGRGLAVGVVGTVLLSVLIILLCDRLDLPAVE